MLLVLPELDRDTVQTERSRRNASGPATWRARWQPYWPNLWPNFRSQKTRSFSEVTSRRHHLGSRASNVVQKKQKVAQEKTEKNDK